MFNSALFNYKNYKEIREYGKIQPICIGVGAAAAGAAMAAPHFLLKSKNKAYWLRMSSATSDQFLLSVKIKLWPPQFYFASNASDMIY